MTECDFCIPYGIRIPVCAYVLRFLIYLIIKLDNQLNCVCERAVVCNQQSWPCTKCRNIRTRLKQTTLLTKTTKNLRAITYHTWPKYGHKCLYCYITLENNPDACNQMIATRLREQQTAFLVPTTHARIAILLRLVIILTKVTTYCLQIKKK